MKLSIFTTTTAPARRGDAVREAMACYHDLADEVVNVSGDWAAFSSPKGRKDIIVRSRWPQEFHWSLIGEQFQRGYDACTGDWVIKMDVDSLIHENDFSRLREFLEQCDAPAAYFYKYQFILPDRYNIKSRPVFAVNKRAFGNRIRFDAGGDLCQVSLDGNFLAPDDVPNTNVALWNYEKLLKTKEQIADDVGRMERAWKRDFGKTQYGSDGTNEHAFDKWMEAQRGKFNKPQESIPLERHPKYVQETIKNLRPDQFGFNGFGLIEGRVYA